MPQIRESLAADARHATMVDTPMDGTQFLVREENGGKTTVQRTDLNKGTMPYWVKLVRTGDKLTGYESIDGKEWKQTFRDLMHPFISTDHLPLDIVFAIRNYLQNPAASSCSDVTLMRTLKLYDTVSEQNPTLLLERLPYKAHFIYNGKRIFEKGEQIRKRFRCKEISTNAIYLFSPLAEVELVE